MNKGNNNFSKWGEKTNWEKRVKAVCKTMLENKILSIWTFNRRISTSKCR